MSNTQEDQPSEALIGQIVGGKYKIVKILGEGGMGCVYEGEQKLGDTIRKVAIKTLHPHLSHDPKVLARFEREVGTVASLQHPNTIQVFDFGKTDNGQLYIVMEYVSGRSVADWLEKDGPMQPMRVRKILEQVTGSLEEAHNLGIVHRDLKPDNVVLCDKAGQKDWVEVLDFGIAKRSTEVDTEEKKLTQQGMVLGTPPYMSPEQFTGKPIDKRSDIYSLGVMSYEMLTGRLPFSGNTAWEWATAHMTAQPISLDATPQGANIPPAMKTAITKALEKDPNARWSSVSEFYHAFAGDPLDVLHPPVSGTAAMPVGSMPEPSGRVKTEMGAPMGGPPQNQGYGGMQQQQGAGTPPGGSHAYTPNAFPQAAPAPMMAAPPQQQQSGGGKGALIAIIGIVGVLSIGAVIAYFVSSGGGGKKPVIATNAVTVTAPTTTQTVIDTGSGTTTLDTGKLAPLNTTKPPPYIPPVTHKDAAVATHPTVPTTTTATETPQPPKNPDECDAAKVMLANGRQAEFDTLKQACLAKGGHL